MTYLNTVTSQCLTAAECIASSNLVTTSTMVCSSSCATTLYWQVSLSYCFTNTECLASGSNSGLATPSTKTCVTTCAGSLFKLVSTNQCLTALECQTAGAGGLTEPSNSLCLSSCPVSEYNLVVTKQCLTSTECIAASGTGGGLKSETAKTCVNSCDSSLYYSAPTYQCLTSTQCNALPGKYAPTSMQCEAACTATEYLNPTSTICYTKPECAAAGMYWKYVSGGNLCVTSCAPLEYIDSVAKSCLTKPQCMATSKMVESVAYTCVQHCPAGLPYLLGGECYGSCPATYYLEESNNSCVTVCLSLVTTDGTKCLRNIVLSVVAAAHTAADTIQLALDFLFKDNQAKAIVSVLALPTELIVQICVNSSSAPSTGPTCGPSIITSTELTATGQLLVTLKNRSITSDTDTVQITMNTAIQRFFDGYRGELLPTPVYKSQISKTYSTYSTSSFYQYTASALLSTSIVVSASTQATPLLLSTVTSSAQGAALLIIAQSYSKLVTLTKFSFRLDSSTFSKLYYSIFKESTDGVNESILASVLGRQAILDNKQYVCRSGFWKLCFLNAEDNFFIIHFFALSLIGVEALLLFLLAKLLGLFGMVKIAQTLIKRLKNTLWSVFILERGLRLWLALILNAHIQIYEILVLGIAKVVGFSVLAVFICSILFLLIYKNEKKGTPKVFVFVFDRFKDVLGELTLKPYEEWFTKAYLLHDFLLAIITISGSFLRVAQLWIWVTAEVVIISTLCCKKIFHSTFLYYRQLFVEVCFLALLIQMALVDYLPSTFAANLTIGILVTSATIMAVNMLLILYELSLIVKGLFMRATSKHHNKISAMNSAANSVIFDRLAVHRSDTLKDKEELAPSPNTSKVFLPKQQPKVSILNKIKLLDGSKPAHRLPHLKHIQVSSTSAVTGASLSSNLINSPGKDDKGFLQVKPPGIKPGQFGISFQRVDPFKAFDKPPVSSIAEGLPPSHDSATKMLMPSLGESVKPNRRHSRQLAPQALEAQAKTSNSPASHGRPTKSPPLRHASIRLARPSVHLPAIGAPLPPQSK